MEAARSTSGYTIPRGSLLGRMLVSRGMFRTLVGVMGARFANAVREWIFVPPHLAILTSPTLLLKCWCSREHLGAWTHNSVRGAYNSTCSRRLGDANAVDMELRMDSLESPVVLEISGANAVDVELSMDSLESPVMLELSEPDAVDFNGLEVTIQACPSVKRLEDSLQ